MKIKTELTFSTKETILIFLSSFEPPYPHLYQKSWG